MFTPRVLIALLCAATLIGAIALVVAACSDDDEGAEDPTPTATAEPAATATAETTTEPAPSSEIRSVDLAATEPVQVLEQTTGGTFDENGVLYGDVTGDNVEEAVAPISSDGSAGTVAVSVLTPAGEGAVTEILQAFPDVGGGLVANIVDGQLVLTEPAPGPDDPECCPSQLRTTIYMWDGSALVIENETVSPNVQGGSTTPTSP